jgi:hypothetical protein
MKTKEEEKKYCEKKNEVQRKKKKTSNINSVHSGKGKILLKKTKRLIVIRQKRNNRCSAIELQHFSRFF